jgi:hypothetical protein
MKGEPGSIENKKTASGRFWKIIAERQKEFENLLIGVQGT